ncbi:MAG: hypothetical protein V4538_01710 [Bacteroidota bacterium]
MKAKLLKLPKVSFLFAWYDLWVGIFWDRKKRWLYILPVPCTGIIVKFEKQKPANEISVVRYNLMNQEGYTPYCGNDTCILLMHRTTWNIDTAQFECKCGWRSQFPSRFIARYKARWNK